MTVNASQTSEQKPSQRSPGCAVTCFLLAVAVIGGAWGLGWPVWGLCTACGFGGLLLLLGIGALSGSSPSQADTGSLGTTSIDEDDAHQPVPHDTSLTRTVWRLSNRTADRILEKLDAPFDREGVRLGQAAKFDILMYLLNRARKQAMQREEDGDRIGGALYRHFFYRITGAEPAPDGDERGLPAFVGERFRTYFKGSDVMALIARRYESNELLLVKFLALSGTGDEPKSAYFLEDMPPIPRHAELLAAVKQLESSYLSSFDTFVEHLIGTGSDPLSLQQQELDRRSSVAKAMIKQSRPISSPDVPNTPALPTRDSASQADEVPLYGLRGDGSGAWEESDEDQDAEILNGFPKLLGGFVRGRITHYEGSGNGVGAGYQDREFQIKLDTYLYDRGYTSIPDGATSSTIRAQFELEKQGIIESGIFDSTRLPVHLGDDKLELSQGLTALQARFRVDVDAVQFESVLIFTGLRKQFLKLRLTFLYSEREQCAQALRTLLADLPAKFGYMPARAPMASSMPATQTQHESVTPVTDASDDLTGAREVERLKAHLDSLGRLFLHVADLYYQTLIRLASPTGQRMATATLFEVRMYLAGKMYVAALDVNHPEERTVDLLLYLCGQIALRTPGCSNRDEAMVLMSERMETYRRLLQKPGADNQDLLNLLIDYISSSGTDDIPVAFNGWPPRASESERQALRAAVAVAELQPGIGWQLAMRNLFLDTADIGKVAVADMERRFRDGLIEGERRAEIMANASHSPDDPDYRRN